MAGWPPRCLSPRTDVSPCRNGQSCELTNDNALVTSAPQTTTGPLGSRDNLSKCARPPGGRPHSTLGPTRGRCRITLGVLGLALMFLFRHIEVHCLTPWLPNRDSP